MGSKPPRSTRPPQYHVVLFLDSHPSRRFTVPAWGVRFFWWIVGFGVFWTLAASLGLWFCFQRWTESRQYVMALKEEILRTVPQVAAAGGRNGQLMPLGGALVDEAAGGSEKGSEGGGSAGGGNGAVLASGDLPGNIPVQVQDFRVTAQGKGKAQLKFSFANLSNRELMGKMCVVLAYEMAGGALGLGTIPDDLEADEESLSPRDGCRSGQLVRFSRLRPTALPVPVATDKLQKVRIFFLQEGHEGETPWEVLYENRGGQWGTDARSHLAK